MWRNLGGESLFIGKKRHWGAFYSVQGDKELMHDVLAGVQGPIQRRRPLGA